MRSATTALLFAACLLAACHPAGGRRSPDSPFPPAGPVDGEEAVDGLTVGHRLMAAGEYELALKAYLRAAADQGLNVDVLSAMGTANLHLGRLGQAEKLLRLAVKKDGRFVPAWNNLGVVLVEQGKYGEASRVFQTAFALDSGQTESIRQNLTLALAKMEEPDYDPVPTGEFTLVRRGHGEYLLLTKH